MPVTKTVLEKRPSSLAIHDAAFNHVDVTVYAAGGWVPDSKPSGANANIGIITVWQETADLVLRWDATNGKVMAFVMSTGVEAGAVDIGEVSFYLINLTS